LREGETKMSWKLWRPLALGLLGLALAGCQEPTEIIPAALPGTGDARIAPKEEKEPEALGEPAMQTPSDPTLKPAVAGTISPPTAPGETKTTPSGVTYETLKPGGGVELRSGQTATVRYTGTLSDGKVFDSTHKGDKDEPATLLVAPDVVISGWVEGLPGMKVGEVRKLTIPPASAYGSRGRPPSIPADATLVFEVELVEIK
jgi:FKBP-type peptidyl-prolyl cis-trans isomerase FkpA